MTLRLYVSDVHLEPGDTPEDHRRLLAFCNLLRAAQAAKVDEIYVLGDLCEMWIGDDDDTGLTLLADPCRLADGTLLAHGDSLCTDDNDYQQMRSLLRSSEWQADILSKSLDERRAFGAALRAQSVAANANKASNIMDVNAQAVIALVDQNDTALLIHGHTHRPGNHQVSADCQRFVLGAWERCGWWALQRDHVVALRCAGVNWLSNQSVDALSQCGALTLAAPSESETPRREAQ